MAKIGGKKGFFIWLAIALFALLLLGLAFIGILYMSPNRVMLGLVYAKYTDSHTYEYNTSTDISTLEISSIEISSERSNINILPLPDASVSKTIVVHQVRKFEGFSVANVGSPTYDGSFASHTLKIITTEPFPFATNSSTYINVYVSHDLELNSVKAISTYGNVSISTYCATSSFTLHSANLQTRHASSIKVGDVSGIEDYYFRTNRGNVEFSHTEFSASSVTFQSFSGTFNLYNNSMTGTLSVTDRFTCHADGSRATVRVNKVFGEVHLSGVGGDFSFNQIGKSDAHGSIIGNVDYANIFIDTLFGEASIMESTTSCSSNVYIKSIVSTRDSTFHVGSGSLRIDSTDSTVSAESTSGAISLKSITQSSSVYAYSTSGDIYLEYLASSDRHDDTNVTALTDSGDISLVNISGVLTVDVRSNSQSAKLNISFNAIAKNSEKINSIKAGGRVAHLTWLGNSTDLKCKLFTTTTASSSSSSMMSKVEIEDSDYELDSYPDYSSQYRVSYSEGSTGSYTAGRLFVSASSHVRLILD